MSDYWIIAYDNEPVGTSNLLDAVDIIKRIEKRGKKVLVFTGSVVKGPDFIRRVKEIYR